MGEIVKAIVPEQRPKSLAIGTRAGQSGVSTVHGAAVSAANPIAQGVKRPTEKRATCRLRSPERTAVRADVSDVIDDCMAEHGVNNVMLAEWIDEPKEGARQIRMGWKPLTADHLWRLARKAPDLYQDIVTRLREERPKE